MYFMGVSKIIKIVFTTTSEFDEKAKNFGQKLLAI